MTLGGLALAVGILVDDATVTIENINWHLEHGKDVITAIMDGARQIVQPAFVSLLCICIVFVPMFALQGVAGFLFVPMAMSVVFAMIASFILSRTLVPTLALYLLKPHARRSGRSRRRATCWRALQRRFESGFDGVARELSQPAGAGDEAPPAVRVRLSGRGGGVLAAGALPGSRLLSHRGYRPDHACMSARPRAPASRTPPQIVGPDRSAKSAASFRSASWPPSSTISACHQSPINMIYNNTGMIGLQDGDIFISLNEDHHPTADYVRTHARKAAARFSRQSPFPSRPPTSSARS